ncbi:MAG: PEGA domain-containing protein [Firmicutes bacterium]|nr:PEGA domain-containing protein [Bacillota bacterium]MDH7494345.1 PEGA domain-containing protein [Bacillota bacterium]
MTARSLKWAVVGMVLLAVSVLPQIGAYAQDSPVKLFINPNPSPEFKAEIWVDRGQGATYYPGENINVYYRVSRDSYVYILDILASGELRWLVRDTWIRANRAYTLSGTVEPPSGTEYLIMFASTQKLPMSDLEESARSGQVYIKGEADIVLGNIQAKIKIVPQKSWVSGYTYFYVGGAYPPIPQPQPVPQPPVPQPQPVQKYGSVSVSTYPSGATVFLDGFEKGKSPIVLQWVPFGEHEVTLVLAGYYTVTRRFELNYAHTYYVTSSMKRIQ